MRKYNNCSIQLLLYKLKNVSNLFKAEKYNYSKKHSVHAPNFYYDVSFIHDFSYTHEKFEVSFSLFLQSYYYNTNYPFIIYFCGT